MEMPLSAAGSVMGVLVVEDTGEKAGVVEDDDVLVAGSVDAIPGEELDDECRLSDAELVSVEPALHQRRVGEAAREREAGEIGRVRRGHGDHGRNTARGMSAGAPVKIQESGAMGPPGR